MVFMPGQKLRAHDLNRGIPDLAFRSTTGAVTSTTTLANAAGLVLPVEAGHYVMEGNLIYQAATGGDLKLGFTSPADTTGYIGVLGLVSGATSGSGDLSAVAVASNQSIIIGGSGGLTTAQLNGYFDVLADGNIQFQYAQGTSSATATQLMAGSWFSLRRAL